ncbi:MAG: hypothetical protein IJ057_05390 [Bacteroidales bacterium]|nr:hypothetical protein [Bacteroidales bacterium]
MEYVFAIVALLSLVAFVVGMFKPTIVKCKSRGRVALIYVSAFLVSSVLGSYFSDKKQPTIDKHETTQVQEQDTSLNSSQQVGTANNSKSEEMRILAAGDIITIPHANNNVEIMVRDIKTNRIPGNGINLVLTLRIKNNSNQEFFVSDYGFKLLDSEMYEVEESGIYDRTFGDFMPGMFFFTIVEPNIGKEKQVGFSVRGLLSMY